jgi:hypothetical protein
MHRSLLSIVLSLSLLLSALVAAQDASYTFTTIDVPGGNATQVFGINTLGQTVGYYIDASGLRRPRHLAEAWALSQSPTLRAAMSWRPLCVLNPHLIHRTTPHRFCPCIPILGARSASPTSALYRARTFPHLRHPAVLLSSTCLIPGPSR